MLRDLGEVVQAEDGVQIQTRRDNLVEDAEEGDGEEGDGEEGSSNENSSDDD